MDLRAEDGDLWFYEGRGFVNLHLHKLPRIERAFIWVFLGWNLYEQQQSFLLLLEMAVIHIASLPDIKHLFALCF